MRIMVVCGGFSSEREVSLRSGRAVYNALVEFGYDDVVLFDMNKSNMIEIIRDRPDVVFLALHGRGGEDGCIQGMLELSGIPYTGSGVEASAICMNKLLAKKIMLFSGIPTADYVKLSRAEWEKDRFAAADSVISRLGERTVVKAPSEGSTIGVVIAHGREELSRAIDEVFAYGDTILIEEYLDGAEVTLTIIGKNTSPQTLPIIEILTANRFYDYDAKYGVGGSKHIIPATIDRQTELKVSEIGKNVYRELGCEGIARVDFIIDKNKGPIVMEVNTLPGMTKTSLVPDAARAAGISFPELCSKIVAFALEKKPKK